MHLYFALILLETMPKSRPYVFATESRLIRRFAEVCLTWAKIQEITGRSPDTINTHVNGEQFAGPGPGQPKKVSKKVSKKLERVADQLQKVSTYARKSVGSRR